MGDVTCKFNLDGRESEVVDSLGCVSEYDYVYIVQMSQHNHLSVQMVWSTENVDLFAHTRVRAILVSTRVSHCGVVQPAVIVQ